MMHFGRGQLTFMQYYAYILSKSNFIGCRWFLIVSYLQLCNDLSLKYM